jgi:predicted phosphohydrolase
MVAFSCWDAFALEHKTSSTISFLFYLSFVGSANPSMASQNKLRVIKLPGQRLRKLAAALLKLHPLHSSPLTPSATSASPIRIVCISNTHNTRPDLPPGDILIHAGDLTENGSFDEIQAQLTWLCSQPHRHKLLVAGNHDVLLDEAFLAKYPERKYGQTKTMHDLDWGNVHYLRDSSKTLHFAVDGQQADLTPSNANARGLIVYGSPWTPQYGVSAFQHRRDQDVWANKIPSNTDIIIAHGPPRLHLDTRDFYRAGCPFLSQEIARVRPRLVVFGHIHVSYGREDVVLDGARRAYEDILNNEAGWGALIRLAACVSLAGLSSCFGGRKKMIRAERITTFVNAAVVGGTKNELQNQSIIVEL